MHRFHTLKLVYNRHAQVSLYFIELHEYYIVGLRIEKSFSCPVIDDDLSESIVLSKDTMRML